VLVCDSAEICQSGIGGIELVFDAFGRLEIGRQFELVVLSLLREREAPRILGRLEGLEFVALAEILGECRRIDLERILLGVPIAVGNAFGPSGRSFSRCRGGRTRRRGCAR
jgi:hypothetical protein